ncbi:MAG: N-acetyltransferase family protein [Dehalococcoidia bacterium]
MMPGIQIRPLGDSDWEILRELRLSALKDSPDSFGPTHESALAQDEAYWRRWAAGRPGRLQAWGAFEGARPVGLISAGVAAERAAHCGALWVSPSARRSGLGRQLLETVMEWASRNGCERLEFEVTEGNPAETLYRSMGFRRTGARHPLREGSVLEEVTMGIDLTPGSA